jgi:hypothetical protein
MPRGDPAFPVRLDCPIEADATSLVAHSRRFRMMGMSFDWPIF